ncbi:cellulose biosynthesis protein BcsN [Rhizobium sp. GN54]|uniref:cellulose biosynthesis protein BcsN n=1 Tax=Rhizobium sp. GN54 TaxID=2898150 RepID=UPI001E5982D7|nr:cellulose biosynthesis protein BcsN [Rhizobium sp. GN54]MCD2180594.1 cellulose biosynthesis protein BcsN [Rhizobium sp. GN54]
MPTACGVRQFWPKTGIAALAAAALVAGCAARDGVRLPAANRIVAESEALIVPAAGGPAVVDVVQRNYANAVEQKVSLFTSSAIPGQNYLSIQMFGPMDAALDGENRLGFRPVHAGKLSAEMRQQIPGVAMKTSQLYLQNHYGPFGYAYGRSAAGDSCLYGWQQLRARDNERTLFQNRGNIQIRARLCASDADERELLAIMYGYTINGTFEPQGWNPYGPPRPADPAIGEDSSPIVPGASELSTRAARPVASPPRVRRVAVERAETDAADGEGGPSPRPAVVVPSPAAVPSSATGARTAEPGATVVVPAPGCVDAACN